jgi:hypothetical protein
MIFAPDSESRAVKMFRLYLIYLAARFLRIPIRVADEFWVGGFTARGSSANLHQPAEH